MPYAPVNDLSMYYEVHGEGPPLILLHGAYMTAEATGPLASGLAGIRQVIVPEMQGHGRTADADRPLTYEQMADDVAALSGHLDRGQADVVGYSMGGATALQLAIRHPALVRRLVVASAGFRYDSMPAEAIAMFPSITPEMFAGSPRETEYLRLAPNPDDFPKLVEKLKALHTTDFAWPEEDIRGIAAPTLIVLGDSDVRLEARGGDVQAAGRRRDGRPRRHAGAPARGPARHLPLHPARLRPPRPHGLAAGDDPAVPHARVSRTAASVSPSQPA